MAQGWFGPHPLPRAEGDAYVACSLPCPGGLLCFLPYRPPGFEIMEHA